MSCLIDVSSSEAVVVVAAAATVAAGVLVVGDGHPCVYFFFFSNKLNICDCVGGLYGMSISTCDQPQVCKFVFNRVLASRLQLFGAVVDVDDCVKSTAIGA